MYKRLISSVIGCMFVITSHAKVNVHSEFQRNIKGFAEIRVHNKMIETLACYIALDGHKRKFVLPIGTVSSWYTAGDVRFNYSSFSTWCDFLSLHPEYEKYRTR